MHYAWTCRYCLPSRRCWRGPPSIPLGDFSYEPKWDGFRSIVFRDRDEVEIGSRNGRPMNRYFPEVVAAVRSGLPDRCVVDGEIVVPDASHARLDFEALQQRIHPAESRVKLLAQYPGALRRLPWRTAVPGHVCRSKRACDSISRPDAAPLHLEPVTNLA